MSENDTPRIIIDDSRVMLRIVVLLTVDIYDHNKFMVLATPHSNSEIFGVYKYPPHNATLSPPVPAAIA